MICCWRNKISKLRIRDEEALERFCITVIAKCDSSVGAMLENSSALMVHGVSCHGYVFFSKSFIYGCFCRRAPAQRSWSALRDRH